VLRSSCRTLSALALAIGVVGLVTWSSVQSQTRPTTLTTAKGEWPSYHGSSNNNHYSPLDQINATNFSKLEVAWSFKTDFFGTRPEFKLEGTPLMVGGVVYATAGTRRSVIAVDAGTGELLWMHSEFEGQRGADAPRQLSGRGLSYWTDGREKRILYVTPGFQLVALDAATGARIAGFGKAGMIDLKESVVYGTGTPIDMISGEAGLHATPAIAGDTVIIGVAFREGHTARTHNNSKGVVQAFDIRTGKRLWNFNTIPRPGEFGNDTWEENSWAFNGNTGVWNQMAVDEELGLVYLPVETPSSDFYGGHRPGNNLFAESLVAVDLKTGKRKWHFQLVHHPIWNFDISTGPILEDFTIDGRQVKAVSVMGKQAMVYVFDRATGQPIWPIEERPVPQSDVPGEKTSPTQPIPTKPPAYDRNGVMTEDLLDFTPALRAEAIELLKMYKAGPVFTPFPLSKITGPLAGFRSGATNVYGGAFDPELQYLFIPSSTSNPSQVGLMPPPNQKFSDIRYVRGDARTGVRYIAGPGEGAGADAPPPAPAPAEGGAAGGREIGNLNPQGLPLFKPPYGKITAVDMKRGEFAWQIAHGETPDNIKNHPALKGLNIPRTGQPGSVGLLATKTLLIAGEPIVTRLASGARGAMLRAYDKSTGKEVGAVTMPAPQTGTPMTYLHNGKQYVIVAVSGGNYSGEYIAFRLNE
jgi:quinoprotein glucose dehydrogenase